MCELQFSEFIAREILVEILAYHVITSFKLFRKQFPVHRTKKTWLKIKNDLQNR